jgi:hypothetical protein
MQCVNTQQKLRKEWFKISILSYLGLVLIEFEDHLKPSGVLQIVEKSGFGSAGPHADPDPAN